MYKLLRWTTTTSLLQVSAKHHLLIRYLVQTRILQLRYKDKPFRCRLTGRPSNKMVEASQHGNNRQLIYAWYGASLHRTIIYIGVELEKIHNCHPKIEDLNGVMALTVNGDNFGQFTAINSWYLSIVVTRNFPYGWLLARLTSKISQFLSQMANFLGRLTAIG